MEIDKIKRGDLFIAKLGYGHGSEQGGTRPVLIIQNQKGNKYSNTTIVACLTTKIHHKPYLPTHFILPKLKEIGLKKKSVVLLEQIKVIDKNRLIKKIGHVNDNLMYQIDKKIKISICPNKGIERK